MVSSNDRGGRFTWTYGGAILDFDKAKPIFNSDLSYI